MEGAHFIKSGKLVKLSEQQCLDCATEAQGCHGGYIEDCLDYAEGDDMDLEKDYPYNAYDGSCWSKSGGPVKVNSFNRV